MCVSLLYLILAGFCGLRSVLEVTADDYGDNFDFKWHTTPSTTTVFYAPNPGYDPYWIGGQWVFGTPASTQTRVTTKRPPWEIYKQRVLVCGRPCPRLYRKLKGSVCVHQLDNVYDPKYNGYWKNADVKGFIDWRLGGVMDRNSDYLRTFQSYCYFLDQQCRMKLYHDQGFVFLHMGACLRDDDAFPNLLYSQSITQRKRQDLREYNWQMSEIRRPGNRHLPSCSCREVYTLCAILLFLDIMSMFSKNNNIYFYVL